MDRTAPHRSVSVALIAQGPKEQVQATWWRPIEWRWPAFAPGPALRVMDWGHERESGAPLHADAILLVPPPGDDAGLFALLGRLADALIPAVVLLEAGAPLNTDEHALTLPRDSDPSLVATVLASLAMRQPAVDALRADAGVCRRFQRGLRRQIETMHEELQAAAAVQRRFMPAQAPRLPAIDVEVLFRPCGYVSGDIYDARLLDEYHVGFFVADAVGHGVPAALMTIMLCRNLPAAGSAAGGASLPSPAAVLRGINDDLVQTHGEASRFATAVYGVIDSRRGRVALAGAGHPYPLRIRGHAVERVETAGGLLGLTAGEDYPEASFVLEEEELLVVYSDGFETAFPAPTADDYGRRLPNTNFLERFTAAARTWREHGSARAVRALIDEIEHQRGSLHQADDLTALMIARRPGDALDHLLAGRASDSAPRERGMGSATSPRA